MKGGGQQPLYKLLSKLGHVIKDLSLNMVLDLGENLGENRSGIEEEEFNARVLGHCGNVRRLTIFHDKDNMSDPRLLFDKIRGLSSLQEIHIIDASESLELWEDIPVEDASNYLAHRLLDVVLDAHASRLRTIVLFGVTPLTIGTFEKIQCSAPKLIRLEIIRGITVHHHESLANPAAWACAANLQHVSLTRCRGVHAAIFTRQLAAGAIGCLRTLRMSLCGDVNSDETLPGATKWTIPALEVLELDNFAEWEMRHFAMIHAKKVLLSCVWQSPVMREGEALITAMRDTATFPGVIELHVASRWGDHDIDDLRAVCLAREIEIVERDWWFEETEAYTKKHVFPLCLHAADPSLSPSSDFDHLLTSE